MAYLDEPETEVPVETPVEPQGDAPGIPDETGEDPEETETV